MISNTDLIYSKLRAFQDARAKLTDDHEKKLKAMERYRGSRGHSEDVKKLQASYEAELKKLRDEYRPGLQSILGAMLDRVGARTVKAPSQEAINLLTALKMQKNPTRETLYRAAQTMCDDPISLEVLAEIASEHGISQSFRQMCPEMSSNEAAGLIQDMIHGGLDEFLQNDTTKISRIASRFYEINHGAPTPLKKRPLFETKEACFTEVFGLSGDELGKFSAIVDEVGS